ncbi:MAG: carboxymuconolactone decarboxylase family protein [Steroidobacteraceae bacterium]
MASNRDERKQGDRFEAGLAVRKQVVGEGYVKAALEGATALTWPLQQLVTEYCWGEIWTREGLSRRDRSLLNLGMLAALNRGQEFKLHVRGALNNGLSREEIIEALLQVTIYCGVPAGVEAVRNAKAVFDEIDAADQAGGGA